MRPIRRHATFLRPRPLSVAEPFRRCSTMRRVLLEYALGDARSYLWVVSKREVRAFTLAPRAEIETLAGACTKNSHDRRVRQGRRSSTGAHVADQRTGLDGACSSSPAVTLLAGKRLVLVLPGALSWFRLARCPTAAAPLIAQHEIVQIPSATTLAAMRSLTAGRSRAPKTAAVFADPIFDAKDPRVLGMASRRRAPAVTFAPRFAGLSLTRLPFSRSEAQAIAALSPKSVTVFLGIRRHTRTRGRPGARRLPFRSLRDPRRGQSDLAEPFEPGACRSSIGRVGRVMVS